MATITASQSQGTARLVVPSGWVGIECDNPVLRLLARLDEDAPNPGDGLGGWEATDRPQQVQMTTWKGNELFTLPLAIVLDGFDDGTSVEPQIRSLYAVARGDDTEPGSVTVRGVPSLPVTDWVIVNIEQGDCIRRTLDFHRVRANLTLHLLEYNPPSWESIKRTALQGARSRTHLITVKHVKGKSGETPAQIARRLRVKWTELRDLNKGIVKSANKPLKAGQRILAPLPAASSKKTKKSRKGSR